MKHFRDRACAGRAGHLRLRELAQPRTIYFANYYIFPVPPAFRGAAAGAHALWSGEPAEA
eukprot:SAG31_NODE_24047_length_490_cov_1.051151_1_plen_59_part_10